MQYCGCTEVDCSVCYSMTASFCPFTINIPCNLTPSTQYYLWIEDKFFNLYNDPVTTNVNGSIDVVTANFPVGLFSADFGPVTVFVTVGNTPIGLVTMNFAIPTNCVIITTSGAIFLTDECGNYLTDENGNYLLAS